MVKSIIRSLLENPVLANILMVLIFLAGFFGAMTMIREIFPKFSLDMISVSVPYPGADPEEVEEGICVKLEEALEGIEGIKEIITTASEGAGSALIECEENADIFEIKDEVKTLVDGITTFPVDAENPIVTEMKFRGEVLAIAVWGDLPERQLKEIARKLEQELVQIDGISQTSVSGVRDYQISIEISEEKLRKYNLTFNDVSQAVARNAINQPAGTIRGNVEDMRIRAIGRRYRAKEFRNIPVIQTDGAVVTLSQLADIKDSFDEDAKVFAFFNGKPAVSIDLFKTEEEDSIKISNAVDEFLERKRRELPESVHLTKFRDNSRMVLDRLSILIDNGKIGLILVFLSLWLFLDIRLSFWVTMGIPISLAGGLAIMSALGCSINMLSLFGMIMILGLIVDDAIVVGESIYARRYGGEDPMEAAVNGTVEVAMPVVAAVMTTIVAFIPLFFIYGVMGKFIRQIPIPVVAALSVSLVEGLFILPIHLRHLPAKGETPKFVLFKLSRAIRGKVAGSLEFFINKIYAPFLDQCLRWRYATLCVAISVMLCVFGLIAAGIIKFIFFPPVDNDFIRGKIEMAAGTPIEKTRRISQKLVDAWSRIEKRFKTGNGKPLTVAVYSLIGSSIDWREGGGQTNKLEVTIELLPSEERDIHYMELVTAWQKEVGVIPGAIATNFQSLRHGPGGNPIEIRLLGSDQKVLLAASDKLMEKIKSYDGTFDVQSDYRPGKREFIIKPKLEAYHHKLTLRDIAKHVQGGYYGDEAIRIQRGRDDVKVKVRYPEKQGRDSVEYLEKLRIKTPGGYMVPFLSVAEVEIADGQSTIKRQNRKRIVLVSSDIDNKKANAKEIMNDLQTNYLPKLMSMYDVSYVIKGQAEETTSSLSSLLIGFPLALFGIYFIIASIFRSYIQPVIIMTTIPFGLIGGVLGHMIIGLPLTIMTMFGMVALAGIVVNDAIVLIEGVNTRLEAGLPLFDALREGGKRRFRAIMLTTITTFSGLMPLIMEKSMQAQFLIPMAVSIAFGVLFATGVTLLLIPCLMAILNDIRRIAYFVWFLRLPSREEMEPRSRQRGNVSQG